MRHSQTSKGRKPLPSLGLKAQREKIVLPELSERTTAGDDGLPKGSMEAYSHHKKHGIGMRQKWERNTLTPLSSHLPVPSWCLLVTEPHQAREAR